MLKDFSKCFGSAFAVFEFEFWEVFWGIFPDFGGGGGEGISKFLVGERRNPPPSPCSRENPRLRDNYSTSGFWWQVFWDKLKFGSFWKADNYADNCKTSASIINTPVIFPKMYLLKRVCNPGFLWLNIIISHIFAENFIEIRQVVQKISRPSLSILAISIDFHWFFWFFDNSLFQRN